MRKVLIPGAGHSALQLALTLPTDQYDVTVMSDRSPEQIAGGRVMSTQVMFHPTLDIEREHGLNLWERDTPRITGLDITLNDPNQPGTPALHFQAPFTDGYAQSVDQRVKMPGWCQMLTARGSKLLQHHVTTSELPDLAGWYDLTIIAAGKGEIGELFARDPRRSPYSEPQRRLAVIYVHGATPRPGNPVGITVIPGVGELFTIPAYTLTGPCDIIFWEAAPQGPLDRWDTRLTPSQHLDHALDLMRTYTPAEYERFAHAEPTDERCNLTGGYAPIVRNPVAEVAPGTLVFGMADAVVANDPIAGQGSNSAARCAEVYRKAILEHGDRPFDRAWMQATFERNWNTHTRYATEFSNMLLRPLPTHVQQLLSAAGKYTDVARQFAHGYEDPARFETWLSSPERAAAYLASLPEPAG
jgi:hypothetical protein